MAQFNGPGEIQDERFEYDDAFACKIIPWEVWTLANQAPSVEF